MPLLKGKENVGKNIQELYAANKSKPAGKKRSRAQIIAIAESAAGNAKPKKKNGGKTKTAPKKPKLKGTAKQRFVKSRQSSKQIKERNKKR